MRRGEDGRIEGNEILLNDRFRGGILEFFEEF